MRGYISLGKQTIRIHVAGQDDLLKDRTVYKVYGRKGYIIRYERLWRTVQPDAHKEWHLTIKRR